MSAPRYQAMFTRLAERGERAFVPFVMLGDPTLEESEAIIETLIAAGADALELGIPFSDPVADGPVIQAAATRAIAAGTTPERALALVAAIRGRHPALPMGLLVYANLVAHADPAAFFARAGRAGVDSVLVADVPSIEAAQLGEEAAAQGVALVLVAPQDSPEATLARIAARGRAYTYVLGRAGVTGADRAATPPSAALLQRLAELGAPPGLVGFGISRPEHVRASIAAGAAGVICGSAVVAIAAAHGRDRAARSRALTDFVQGMKAATRVEQS